MCGGINVLWIDRVPNTEKLRTIVSILVNHLIAYVPDRVAAKLPWVIILLLALRVGRTWREQKEPRNRSEDSEQWIGVHSVPLA
jgi:hypothetical protein